MEFPLTSYEQVKLDSLAGVPNYDWFAQYDGKINTSEFARGYGEGLSDRSGHNAVADPYAYKNLPYNAQNLYAAESEDGTPIGYYLWDNLRAALDLAPLIPNLRPYAWDRTRNCLTGYAKLERGHKQHDYQVQDMPFINVDPGSATGLLFAPPSLPPYQSGRYLTPSFL